MTTQTVTKEWNEVSFSDCLLKVKIGREKQIKEKDYSKSGLYPVVDQGQSFIAGYTDDKNKVISDIQPFIIFGDHTRILKYIDFPIALGADGTKVIKPNEDFDTKFFFYYLKSITVPSRGYNRHYAILKEKQVAHPSIIEQKSIAQALTTVQNAIAEQERLIAKLDELKRSMMQHLFTRGTKGEKTKMTEIGEVPESWEVVELGTIFKFSSGKSRPKDTTKIRSAFSKYPVYGGNGVLGYSLSVLFEDRKLIIGRVGEYCGCVHITESTCWISDNALYVKEELRQVSQDFYKYLLGHWNLNRFSNKMGQPLVTQGILSKVLIPYMEIGKQEAIASALGNTDQKIEATQAKLLVYQSLFKTLLHELMSGERRIKNI